MTAKLYMTLLWVLIGAVGVSQAQAEDKDGAIAELVKAHAKLKSYKADVRTIEDFEFQEGATVESEVNGKVAWMRHNGKLLYWSESKSSSLQKFQGQESATEAKQTMIADGQYFYTIAEMNDTVRVAKQLVNPMLAADAKQILDALADEHEVRFVGEEAIDKAACYTFDIRPRKPDESPHMSRTIIHFRKDAGTIVRTVGFGEKEEVVYRSEHREVKLNPELDRQLFSFTPPEGVEVEDYTK